MFVFNETSVGQIIEGLALLVSVGLNGVLLEFIKHARRYVKDLEKEILAQDPITRKLKDDNQRLNDINASLVMNQKPIPWNKGKKGYKLPRKPKEQTYVLPDNPIEPQWTWTVTAPKSEFYQEVFGE